YTQPEGGGAAGEDFSRWITDAHYNSLQDYSIYEGWYKTSTIEDVIFSGDVALLEKKFRRWRDKIAMLGGTTYLGIIWNSSLSPEQRLLEFVTIVTVGAMLHDDNKLMFSDLPSDIRKKAADMFKLCSSSPALRLNGQREVIICGDGIYAFKRYNNFKNSAVVAMNFSEKTRDLVLDMPTHRLTGSLTSDGLPLPLSGAATPGPLKIRLEPYGYAILILN
ncbi:MAG: hypothetical protein FWH01_00440, partial [Oscillospiraceae bacterium]|nr:hypothetical protein [Oscillospiraceae bacterium]